MGGGSSNDSTYVNTQPGTWVPQTGGDEQFPGEVGDVTPAPNPEEGGPKAPARVPTILQVGHTLFTNGRFDGYTLYLLDDDNECYYTTEVWDDGNGIPLPTTLYGTYLLVFVEEDNDRCYYAEIEL